MYTRYGHVNQIFVKVGDKVKAGQKIATNGTGNGQWPAHLHRDHPKKIPGGNFGFYNIGWTKEKTLEYFNDPMAYPKGLGKLYDHPGLEWLQFWDYATNSNKVTFAKAKSPCFHPGLDENGSGSGNADYDDPIYAVADGVVVSVANDSKASNGGWGKLIVIEETRPEVVLTTQTTQATQNTNNMKPTQKLKDFYKFICDEEAGENINDNEMDRLADKGNEKIYKLQVELDTLREKLKNATVTAHTEPITPTTTQEPVKAPSGLELLAMIASLFKK